MLSTLFTLAVGFGAGVLVGKLGVNAALAWVKAEATTVEGELKNVANDAKAVDSAIKKL